MASAEGERRRKKRPAVEEHLASLREEARRLNRRLRDARAAVRKLEHELSLLAELLEEKERIRVDRAPDRSA